MAGRKRAKGESQGQPAETKKKKILFAWVGDTDILAMQNHGKGKEGNGPIAAAMLRKEKQVDTAYLLVSDDRKWQSRSGVKIRENFNAFVLWLKEHVGQKLRAAPTINSIETDLIDATAEAAIMKWASKALI